MKFRDLILFLFVFNYIESHTQKTRIENPIPNKAQLAWHRAELGAVFHYDLHVFDNKKYRQTGNRTNPVADYQVFNPQKLDTDQWIRAIKKAGFKFAIITAYYSCAYYQHALT